MARKRFAYVLAIAVLALVLPLAAQAGPVGQCNGRIVSLGTGNAGFYLDVRTAPVGGGGGIWAYMEDNGTTGLQRGGVSITLAEQDSCVDQDGEGNPLPPDMVII